MSDRSIREDKHIFDLNRIGALEMRAASLTPREREVLALVADGEPCKIIARQLGISIRTVEGHRAHIIDKLSARGSSDLVRLATIITRL
jgi:two-component system, LuxR family, response regulator FixJ